MKRELRDILYSVAPKEDYLIHGKGGFNVIVSAPHGGGIRPISIPTRKHGTKSMDTYTRRLTDSILHWGMNYNAHYVISDIHRSKVDLNRNIEDGAQGNSKAEKIWNEWNSYLSLYKEEVLEDWGKGLYVDIHSQSKTDDFHIGYGVSTATYNKIKGNKRHSEKTTLSSLGHSEYEMMFGIHSIRNSLLMQGFPVHTPKDDSIYYNGGKSIESFSGHGLGAIQIECPTSIIGENINLCATALTYAIEIFRSAFCR